MTRISAARRWAAAALAAAALAFLAGCTVNPATGQSTFTGGMTTADEVKEGRAAHPKIVAEFGGEYGGPELRQYINSIGLLLQQTVESAVAHRVMTAKDAALKAVSFTRVSIGFALPSLKVKLPM